MWEKRVNVQSSLSAFTALNSSWQTLVLPTLFPLLPQAHFPRNLPYSHRPSTKLEFVPEPLRKQETVPGPSQPSPWVRNTVTSEKDRVLANSPKRLLQKMDTHTQFTDWVAHFTG